MTTVFADTAFYVALVNRRDALHAQATAFLLQHSGRIVTSGFVLTEVGNFDARAALRKPFLDLLDRVRSDPKTEIIPVGPELFDSGLAMFAARPDKDWSLTDCTSFVSWPRWA